MFLHKYFRFSLLGLLLVVAAVAVICGLWRHHHDRFLRQRRIADNILRLVRTEGNDRPIDGIEPGPLHALTSRFGTWVRFEYKKETSRNSTYEPDESCDVVGVSVVGSLEVEDGDTGQPTGGRAFIIGEIAKLTALTSVRIGSDQLTDSDVATLLRLPRLNHLWISSNRITDSALASIGQMSGLTDLDLDSPGITDNGVEHLARLPALKTLHLTGASISAGGFRQLAAVSTLELKSCQISPAGYEGLAGCENLTTLSICKTSISASGARSIGELKPLQIIALLEVAVPDTHFRAMCAWPRMQRIALRNVRQLTPDGLDVLAKLPIISLYIDCPDLGNGIFEHLSKITTLDTLSVTVGAVRDEDLTALSRLPGLQTVYFSGARLSDDQSKFLAERFPGRQFNCE